jgi:hypothetical protein
VAVALVLVPAATWADCVDGTRSGTSEERTFSRQLGESLKAALPAAPAQPDVAKQTKADPYGVNAKDAPIGEW